MAAFDFPSSPTVGQTYTPAGGPTYSWNGVSWNVVATNVSGGFSQQTFTATLGQTVFTVSPGYQPGLIDVFQNGVKLVLGSDYTAATGSTIVLAAPAALGDTIQTICYAAVSGANTYTKAEVDALLAARTNGSAFWAYPNAVQSIPANVPTKLNCNAEVYDADGSYDPVLYRFTPKVPGFYLITGAFCCPGGPYTSAMLYRNGILLAQTNFGSPINSPYTPQTTALMQMNGTTDYAELFGNQGSAGALNTGVGPTQTFFCGAMIRGA